MSFNNYKEKVLNLNLPFGTRVCALKSCFSLVSFSLRARFQTCNITYTNLKESAFKKLGITDESLITEDKVIKILIELEMVRNKSLNYFELFSKGRKIKKLIGQNQVSKNDLKYLKSLENKLIEELLI